MRFTNLNRLLALSLLATLFVRGPILAQGPRLGAKESDLDLALNLRIESPDGNISVCEPLVLEISYKNLGHNSIYMSESGLLTLRVTVFDASGRTLADTNRPPFPGASVLSTGFGLNPGESHLRDLIISALYAFKKPGSFTVRVQHLDLSPEGRVIAEKQISFRVLPYDAKRLDAACQRLLAPGPEPDGKMNSRDELRRIELSNVRRKALYTACGDAALPYLDEMARSMGGEYAILAIRNVGTPRAKKLLKALAVRSDGVGQTARAVSSGGIPGTSDVYWRMGGY